MSAKQFVERHRKFEADLAQMVQQAISTYEKEGSVTIESIDVGLFHTHSMGAEKVTVLTKIDVRIDISN